MAISQLRNEEFSGGLRLQHDPPQMKPEPMLRFAGKAKPAGQRLTDFIKSNGGLNECARQFARNR
jgi:hypothetical protein